MGDKNFGIDQKVLQYIAGELKGISNMGVQIAIVIGGFSLWGLRSDRDPAGIPSVLISKPAPQFDLPGARRRPRGDEPPALEVAQMMP